MERRRIGIIVDRGKVARWQADALATIAADYDLFVYDCTNSRPSPRRARHAFYYALNLWAVRSSLTRQVPLPEGAGAAPRFAFESDYDGAWQRLPPALLDRIRSDRPDVLLKFGMGLLKVPSPDVLPVPILSYHHGDPRAFRGRPAGFHELATGCRRLGQIVQLLSNELDAGRVAAFAETRVHPHSYRATLREAFRTSPLLLRPAIHTTLAGETAVFAKGPAYRLPSNLQVLRFASTRLLKTLARLFYGAFIEKRWQVASAEIGPGGPADLAAGFPPMDRWSVVPRPPGFVFIADPFFHPEGNGALVEGLRPSGKGAILHVADDGVRPLAATNRHWSYPATMTAKGEHFVLPETAQWSPARLFRLRSDRLDPVEDFSIAGAPRLVDPTLFEHDGGYYLFGNCAEEGPAVLRLWVAHAVTGPFSEHPSSPIRISPAGARMAGTPFIDDGTVYRFGQDLTGAYGDGVLLFAIEALTPQAYRESQRALLRFGDVRGPHTVNVRDGRVLFDFYLDRFSPLAGLRRLRAQLAP